MYSSVYPQITTDSKDSKSTKPDKQRNDYVVKLLAKHPPLKVAKDIQRSIEVQQSLKSTDIIIANLLRLRKNNVEFKYGKGAKTCTLTAKIYQLPKKKRFAEPGDLFEWLQSEQVEDFIGNQFEAALPATERDGKSGVDNQKQNVSRNGSRKRKDSEDKDSGNSDARNYKKRRRRRLIRRRVR